jgi:hypothetical protein
MEIFSKVAPPSKKRKRIGDLLTFHQFSIYSINYSLTVLQQPNNSLFILFLLKSVEKDDDSDW